MQINKCCIWQALGKNGKFKCPVCGQEFYVEFEPKKERENET